MEISLSVECDSMEQYAAALRRAADLAEAGMTYTKTIARGWTMRMAILGTPIVSYALADERSEPLQHEPGRVTYRTFEQAWAQLQPGQCAVGLDQAGAEVNRKFR